MKVRTPHLPGKDLKSCPHVGGTATFLHDLAGALILRSREQAPSDGLPDPATQADADVASTTIRSTDVIEARRTARKTVQQLKGYRSSKPEFGFCNGLLCLSRL